MARKQKTWKIGRLVKYQYFLSSFMRSPSQAVQGTGRITALGKDGRYVVDERLSLDSSQIHAYADKSIKRPRKKMSLFEWSIFCAIRAEPQYLFSGEEMRVAKRMAKKRWLKVGKTDRTFETTKIGETAFKNSR